MGVVAEFIRRAAEQETYPPPSHGRAGLGQTRVGPLSYQRLTPQYAQDSQLIIVALGVNYTVEFI